MKADKKFLKVIILLLFLGNVSCTNELVFVDPQGNEYSTVQIGESTWTNENLKFEIQGESYCYNESLSECDTMGRLYTWDGAIQAAENISGWHLPSKTEWEELINFYGGDSLAYVNIMNQDCGFTPQSAGVRLSNGIYVAKKFKGVNYWSSSLADTSLLHAYSLAFMSHLNKISDHNYPIDNACSVRLVKDK